MIPVTQLAGSCTTHMGEGTQGKWVQNNRTIKIRLPQIGGYKLQVSDGPLGVGGKLFCVQTRKKERIHNAMPTWDLDISKINRSPFWAQLSPLTLGNQYPVVMYWRRNSKAFCILRQHGCNKMQPWWVPLRHRDPQPRLWPWPSSIQPVIYQPVINFIQLLIGYITWLN